MGLNSHFIGVYDPSSNTVELCPAPMLHITSQIKALKAKVIPDRTTELDVRLFAIFAWGFLRPLQFVYLDILSTLYKYIISTNRLTDYSLLIKTVRRLSICSRYSVWNKEISTYSAQQRTQCHH